MGDGVDRRNEEGGLEVGEWLATVLLRVLQRSRITRTCVCVCVCVWKVDQQTGDQGRIDVVAQVQMQCGGRILFYLRDLSLFFS